MHLDKICQVTNKPYTLPIEYLEFLKKVKELNPLISVELPATNIKPEVLMRQFSCFGNSINLYKSNSAISSKSILSRYNPKDGLKVCSVDEFYSDEVDNIKSGRPYDFSRSFFEQWYELLNASILLSAGMLNVENCDYINGAANCKNCYLCFSILGGLDCFYCYSLFEGTDCIDCCFSRKLTLCYSCSDCVNCYSCQNCTECSTCDNCIACFDCRSCHNCIGCWGLEQSTFCVFNQQLTKEAYLEFKKNLNLGSYEARTKLLNEFHAKSKTHIPNRIINSEAASGAYIKNSKNLINCYNTYDSQDCGYLVTGDKCTDCWMTLAVATTFSQLTTGYKAYNCHYGYMNYDSENSFYSYQSMAGCSDTFGCVGLKKKSYCILNKQYSKKEYEDLVPRIVKHMDTTAEWGKYFPARYAPNSYNDSWADELLTEIDLAEAKRRGYKLSQNDSSKISGKPTVFFDDINQVNPDEVLKTPQTCQESKMQYLIQKKELDFYKSNSIPLPRLHWKLRLKKMFSCRVRMSE